MPPFLRGTLPPAPAPIRGLARLLPGGPFLAGGGARLRLYPRFVSRALPRVPRRSRSQILRFPVPGAACTAEEIEGARSGDRVAQTEPLGVRDRRGAP